MADLQRSVCWDALGCSEIYLHSELPFFFSYFLERACHCCLELASARRTYCSPANRNGRLLALVCFPGCALEFERCILSNLRYGLSGAGQGFRKTPRRGTVRVAVMTSGHAKRSPENVVDVKPLLGEPLCCYRLATLLCFVLFCSNLLETKRYPTARGWRLL